MNEDCEEFSYQRLLHTEYIFSKKDVLLSADIFLKDTCFMIWCTISMYHAKPQLSTVDTIKLLMSTLNEPAHEIMALFVPCKLILQTRVHSHPVGLDVWLLVGPFVCFHTSCVQTAKALARLRGCAGSPEPSLIAYAISTIISWAVLNT